MKPKITSKNVLKDPTLSKKIVKRYEKSLEDLILVIGDGAREALDNAAKKLEMTKIDASYFNDEVNRVIRIKFTPHAETLAKKYSNETYRAAEARAESFITSIGIEANIGMTPVDERVLRVIESREISALMKVGEDTAADIKRVVSEGVLAGDSIRDIAKSIDAETEIGIARATTTARTETLYAFNTALKQQYEKYGIDNVEWLTAWDDRVCDICEPLNGKQYKRVESPECPAHPNCRCTLLPVIEEVE